MFLQLSFTLVICLMLGIPQVREKNLYKEGDTTHFRQALEGVTLGRCWSQVLEQSQYQQRLELIKQYNL